MVKLIVRILAAAIIALLLASCGVRGNNSVLQTLFTVLGIVFSISMSLIVSFNLSKILNKSIRRRLRSSIIHTRNMLLMDFGVSTICLVFSLIWDNTNLIYHFNYFSLDIMLFGVSIVATSLIYEIFNFRKLHKLHTDIEDAVLIEESNKCL